MFAFLENSLAQSWKGRWVFFKDLFLFHHFEIYVLSNCCIKWVQCGDLQLVLYHLLEIRSHRIYSTYLPRINSLLIFYSNVTLALTSLDARQSDPKACLHLNAEAASLVSTLRGNLCSG